MSTSSPFQPNRGARRFLLLVALLLLPAPALAQVPPTGSGQNGWLQAIYTVLGGGTGANTNLRTVLFNSFSGADTAGQNATLTGATGKNTFICGFNVSGLGSTSGGTVIMAIANGASQLNFNYIFTASAATANTPVGTTFSPCLSTASTGASWSVSVPGSSGNTSTNISVWGYQQ